MAPSYANLFKGKWSIPSYLKTSLRINNPLEFINATTNDASPVHFSWKDKRITLFFTTNETPKIIDYILCRAFQEPLLQCKKSHCQRSFFCFTFFFSVQPLRKVCVANRNIGQICKYILVGLAILFFVTSAVRISLPSVF